MRAVLVSTAIVAGLCLVDPRPALADEPPVAAPAPTTENPPAPTAAPTPSTATAGTEPPPVIEPAPQSPMRFTGMLGVISLPRILALDLLVRFRKKNDPNWDLFALGAGIEYLPPGIANFGEDTTLSWLQVGPEGRFFFFRWLFAGVRIGYQFSRADSEKFGSEVDYVTTSGFVAPKLGALYTFKSGFTIGGDLGATLPFLVGTSIESDGTTDSNARKASKTFGMWAMPFLSLRIGWTL